MNSTVEKVKFHLEAIFDLLGFERTESNTDTPLRVAKMYVNELFRTRNDAGKSELDSMMTTFPYESSKSGLYRPSPIVVSDIPFHSVCEHHWLPFFGKVSVEYVPRNRIIGLSKIPRVVKYYAQRPQLQERFTNNIGDYLVGILHPQSLIVTVEATHTCVGCRGAESDCVTSTRYEFQFGER